MKNSTLKIMVLLFSAVISVMLSKYAYSGEVPPPSSTPNYPNSQTRPTTQPQIVGPTVVPGYSEYDYTLQHFGQGTYDGFQWYVFHAGTTQPTTRATITGDTSSTCKISFANDSPELIDVYCKYNFNSVENPPINITVSLIQIVVNSVNNPVDPQNKGGSLVPYEDKKTGTVKPTYDTYFDCDRTGVYNYTTTNPSNLANNANEFHYSKEKQAYDLPTELGIKISSSKLTLKSESVRISASITLIASEGHIKDIEQIQVKIMQYTEYCNNYQNIEYLGSRYRTIEIGYDVGLDWWSTSIEFDGLTDFPWYYSQDITSTVTMNSENRVILIRDTPTVFIPIFYKQAIATDQLSSPTVVYYYFRTIVAGRTVQKQNKSDEKYYGYCYVPWYVQFSFPFIEAFSVNTYRGQNVWTSYNSIHKMDVNMLPSAKLISFPYRTVR